MRLKTSADLFVCCSRRHDRWLVHTEASSTTSQLWMEIMATVQISKITQSRKTAPPYHYRTAAASRKLHTLDKHSHTTHPVFASTRLFVGNGVCMFFIFTFSPWGLQYQQLFSCLWLKMLLYLWTHRAAAEWIWDVSLLVLCGGKDSKHVMLLTLEHCFVRRLDKPPDAAQRLPFSST